MLRHYVQWLLNAGEESYTISNLGPNSERRYYQVVMGKYGEPCFVAEPDLAFPCSEVLIYVNAKDETSVPDEKIAGIVCSDGQRFSLTNAKNKGILIVAQDDGSIKINDQTWWVKTLFRKDKNRIINYDAYLSKTKPEKVRIIEMADLADSFCS
jgi:hypothetical protein